MIEDGRGEQILKELVPVAEQVLRNVSMILRHPGTEITVASVRSEPPLGVD